MAETADTAAPRAVADEVARRPWLAAGLEWLLIRPWRLVLAVTLLIALPLLVANESSIRTAESRLDAERRLAALSGAERAAEVVDLWLTGRSAGLAELPELEAAVRSGDVETIQDLMFTTSRVLLGNPRDFDFAIVATDDGLSLWRPGGVGPHTLGCQGEYVDAEGVRRAQDPGCEPL